MSLKRILYVIAAVLFFLAWLVFVGTITTDTEAFKYQALIALGLCVGFFGHAV